MTTDPNKGTNARREGNESVNLSCIMKYYYVSTFSATYHVPAWRTGNVCACRHACACAVWMQIMACLFMMSVASAINLGKFNQAETTLVAAVLIAAVCKPKNSAQG